MNKQVIIVQDDPDDMFITESILQELNLKMEVKFIHNSEELFSLLKTGNKPHLILTDFNSKPANGISIIQRIKKEDTFRSIPVVVLGDSTAAAYVKQCYDAGACSVIKKPDSYLSSKNKILDFFNYWLNVAELHN